MCATEKNLHYILKGVLEVCNECDTAKNKQKLIHKVAEESDLNPGKINYLDLISQKKSSYGGSNNWILIQDSDTKQKWSFFMDSR